MATRLVHLMRSPDGLYGILRDTLNDDNGRCTHLSDRAHAGDSPAAENCRTHKNAENRQLHSTAIEYLWDIRRIRGSESASRSFEIACPWKATVSSCPSG